MEKLNFDPQASANYLSTYFAGLVGSMFMRRIKTSDVGQLAVESIAVRTLCERVVEGNYSQEDKHKAELAIKNIRELNPKIIYLYRSCSRIKNLSEGRKFFPLSYSFSPKYSVFVHKMSHFPYNL